jgi:SAM-dependent methyltransferase
VTTARAKTLTKPKHLSAEYAAQFQQRDIARAYCTRPPYPGAVFDLLASLLPEAARVLELGAGTGDLTVGLAKHCGALDAVEPSAAMLDLVRARGSWQPIVWHHCAAEQFAFTGRYDLVVAAESLHWMARRQPADGSAGCERRGAHTGPAQRRSA